MKCGRARTGISNFRKWMTADARKRRKIRGSRHGRNQKIAPRCEKGIGQVWLVRSQARQHWGIAQLPIILWPSGPTRSSAPLQPWNFVTHDYWKLFVEEPQLDNFFSIRTAVNCRKSLERPPRDTIQLPACHKSRNR